MKVDHRIRRMEEQKDISGLEEMLSSGNQAERRRAAAALGRLGDRPAVGYLINVLEGNGPGDQPLRSLSDFDGAHRKADLQPDVKYAKVLHEIAYADAANNFKAVNLYLKAEAAKALGEIGHKKAMKSLKRVVSVADEIESDTRVKWLQKRRVRYLKQAATTALEKIEAKEAERDRELPKSPAVELDANTSIEDLIASADIDDWNVRHEIAQALAGAASLEIPVLVSALENSSWYVRNCIGGALQRLGWQPSSQRERILLLIATLRSNQSYNELMEIGDEAVEYLRPLLGDRCQWAAERCGSIVNAIEPRPLDPSSPTKRSWPAGKESRAAEAFQVEELRLYIDSLRRSAELPEEDMRAVVEAEESLDVETLSAMVREGPPRVRRAALHALGRMAIVMGAPSSNRARQELATLISAKLDALLSDRSDIVAVLSILKKTPPNAPWLQQKIRTGEYLDYDRTGEYVSEYSPVIQVGQRMSISDAVEAICAWWHTACAAVEQEDIPPEERHARIRGNRLYIVCKGGGKVVARFGQSDFFIW